MKKVLSFVLSLVLVFSLCIVPTLGVRAFETSVPSTTNVVGSGVPAANYIYSDGDYRFEAIPGGCIAQYYNGAFQLSTPDTGWHDTYYCIDYPIDANTGVYSLNLDIQLVSDARVVKFYVYGKDKTTRYINGVELTYWNSIMWKAGDQNAKAGDKFKFTIDTNTGKYSGKLNDKVFSPLGDMTNSIPDLSGGIGRFVIGISYDSTETKGSGAYISRSAIVNETTGELLAGGIPTNNHTYKDGDFEAAIVPYESHRAQYTGAANVSIINHNNDRHSSKLQIKNNRENSANLTFEYDIQATGHKLYTEGTALKVYSKTDSTTPILSFGNMLYSSGEWRLNGDTPSSMNRITIKLNIDLTTGTWTLYGGNYPFNGGSGTIDVSNGIGMAELALKTDYYAGDSIVVYGLKLTETTKPYATYSDHNVLINGVPRLGGTHSGIDVTVGSNTVTSENGVIVMSGTGARIQFARTIDANYDKKVYIEAVVSSDKALTNEATVQFNAMSNEGNSPYQISGGNSQFYSTDFSVPNQKYVIGIVVDMKNDTYSIIQNGTIAKSGTIAHADKNIRWMFLGFGDPEAKLTVHNIKYMDIEPITYDAATNTYFDASSILANGIAHYAGVTQWTENGVTVGISTAGEVSVEKLSDCEGIKVTSSDSSDDWARATVSYNFNSENFADKYARVLWDIEIEGTESQTVSVASRTAGGNFPVNVKKTLTAGRHTIEFAYSPITKAYICFFDGVNNGKFKISESELSNVMLEWNGADNADVMTLKNVRVMKLADEGTDTVGDIVIAEDNMSASVNVKIEKLFSTLDGEVNLFIASYADGGQELKAVNVTKQNLTKGDNPINVSLESLEGGTLIKAFLWEAENNAPLK